MFDQTRKNLNLVSCVWLAAVICVCWYNVNLSTFPWCKLKCFFMKKLSFSCILISSKCRHLDFVWFVFFFLNGSIARGNLYMRKIKQISVVKLQVKYKTRHRAVQHVSVFEQICSLCCDKVCSSKVKFSLHFILPVLCIHRGEGERGYIIEGKSEEKVRCATLPAKTWCLNFAQVLVLSAKKISYSVFEVHAANINLTVQVPVIL